MRVKVLNWHTVATWVWDIEDKSDCSICQQPFESPCPKCKFPGDECVPIIGECKHSFHLHCIIKWVDENENCPLCRAKWIEKSKFLDLE